MKLPNAHLAVIEREKIVDYLLDAAHPDNGGKAQFFLDLGFSCRDWSILTDALRRHAAATDASRSIESVHGRKYVLEGPIQTPSGRTPRLRAIWIIDHGLETPRLVTAYPCD